MYAQGDDVALRVAEAALIRALRLIATGCDKGSAISR